MQIAICLLWGQKLGFIKRRKAEITRLKYWWGITQPHTIYTLCMTPNDLRIATATFELPVTRWYGQTWDVCVFATSWYFIQLKIQVLLLGCHWRFCHRFSHLKGFKDHHLFSLVSHFSFSLLFSQIKSGYYVFTSLCTKRAWSTISLSSPNPNHAWWQGVGKVFGGCGGKEKVKIEFTRPKVGFHSLGPGRFWKLQSG